MSTGAGSTQNRRRPLSDFGHMLRYCWRAGRLATIAVGVLMLASMFFPVLMTILQGLLVGSVPDAVAGGPGSPEARRALTFLALSATAMVTYQLLYAAQGLFQVWLGPRYGLEARRAVTRSLNAPAGIGHLEDPVVADELAFLFAPERNTLWQMGPGMATSVVMQWAGGFGSILILGSFAWWFPLVALPAWVIDWRHGSRYAKANLLGLAAASPEVRRAHYLRDMTTGPLSAKETRAFGLADWAVRRYAAAWSAAMEPVWRENRRGIGTLLAAGLAKVAAGVAMFWLLIDRALAGDVSLTAVAIYSPAILAVLALGYLGDTNTYLIQNCSLAGRARALELKLSSRDSAAPVDAPPSRSELPAGEITFESVGFTYPDQDRAVLRDFDLVVPAGRTLALVGDNGAGKTTLIKLLTRLYEPTTGRITVDGIPLQQIDIAEWRKRVAVIFQDFLRWELPLRDNVGFGAPPSRRDSELLKRALGHAGADDLLSELSSGWDTVLSRGYEGGADLSGGQWQKVALARALAGIEAGAQLLVLDEPTANLDVRAEATVFDRLMAETRGTTTILISHRFSSVRRADRIAVIADGKIVEVGSHDELMARGGRYARMYSLQADRFVDERRVEMEKPVG